MVRCSLECQSGQNPIEHDTKDGEKMKRIYFVLLIFALSTALFAAPTANGASIDVKLTIPTEASFGITDATGASKLVENAPKSDSFVSGEHLFSGSENMSYQDAYVWWRIKGDSNKYSIKITSQNSGKLKNGDSSIAYSGELGSIQDNSGIDSVSPSGDLENGISFDISSNMALYYGAVPMTFTALKADIEKATLASEYSDTITVAITAKN